MIIGRGRAGRVGEDPGWWRRTFSLRGPSASRLDVVRAAVTLVVPLGVALATGRDHLLLFVLAPAITIAFTPVSGPPSRDLRPLLTSLVAVLLGSLAGSATAPAQTPAALPVVLVMAALAGLLATSSPGLSMPSTQLLVTYAITSGSAAPTAASVVVPVFAVTAAFALALALLQSARTRPGQAADAATAELLRACAAWLRGSDAVAPVGLVVAHKPPLPLRRAVTRRLDDAWRAVGGLEDLSSAQRRATRTDGALITALSPLVAAIGATPRGSGPAPDQRLAREVEHLADAVSAGRPHGGWDRPDDDPGDGTVTLAARSVRAAARAWDQAWSEHLSPPSARERLRALTSGLGAPAWQQVARYVVVLGAAEVVRLAVPLQKSSWILLTVALIFQPSGVGALPRAVQRSIGTVLGVLVAGAVLVAGPPAWVGVAAVGVLAATGAALLKRSYVALTTCFTPVVLVVASLASSAPLGGVLVDRVVASLVAAVVVAVAGWAVWPSTWRRGARVDLLAALGAVRDYAALAFDDRAPEDGLVPAGASPAVRARRRAYDALAALPAQLAPILTEPRHLADRARASLEVAARLEHVVDALAQAQDDAVGERGAVPGRAEVDAVVAALDDLLGAVREDRAPHLPAMPRGPLARVAERVGDAAEVVGDPTAVRA